MVFRDVRRDCPAVQCVNRWSVSSERKVAGLHAATLAVGNLPLILVPCSLSLLEVTVWSAHTPVLSENRGCRL
jgi:hypothetical protein